MYVILLFIELNVFFLKILYISEILFNIKWYFKFFVMMNIYVNEVL